MPPVGPSGMPKSRTRDRYMVCPSRRHLALPRAAPPGYVLRMDLLLIGMLVASSVHARPPKAAPADERASFVTTLGRDTVVIESFTRTSSRLDGDIVVRVPGTVLCHYTADMGKDGTVSHTVVDITPLATSDVPTERVTMDFHDGLAHITLDVKGQPQKTGTRPFEKGAFPFFMTGFGSSYGLYSSLGMYELFLPRVSSDVNATSSVPSIDMVSAQVGTRRFVRRSPSQIAVDYFGIGWTELMVDADGHITGADATHATTEKTQSSRTDFIDAKRAAQTFAAADHAGHGIGAASPNKVSRGSIGGQPIVVSFGSPKKRGRDILGNVVQYDRVWRTGANEATTIVLPRDASIGGQPVPAGTYSLWTLPAKDGTVNLIINKQHGQWGTDYDQAQDLVRVPMHVETATPPREEFAIDVTGDGNAGALRLAWDTFIWTAPITLK
jgi:Protein of unknown function (DUF2911)